MRDSALQLISSGGLYGAERVAIDLARFLADQGWDSRLAVIDGPTPAARHVLDAARDAGVDAELLPSRGRFDPHTVTALRRHVRRHDTAVVHGHGYKPDVLMRLTPLQRATRRVATCHTWYSLSPRLVAYEWLDKRALRRFDHVAVVSPGLLDEVRRAGVPTDRSSLVLNGLDPAPRPDPACVARLRRQLGLTEQTPLAVRICRLDRDKRVDLLLTAWAQVVPHHEPRPVLAVAGDGPQARELRVKVHQLGLERDVRLLGYRRDISTLMAAAKLMVISSDDEGLPLTLLEAMAARLPVVATAVGAIPTVIDDGRDGLLVPPGDPRSLAGAIDAALRHPAAAVERAGNAHDRWSRNHTRAAMGRRYLALYEGLCDR